MPGFCFFSSSMRCSTSGVATRGFDPPMTPGRIEPVSWYRFNIFDTQPWETRSWREITHGRTPAAAISTIFSRIWFGNGRPFMKTPPNWFTLPWPTKWDERKHVVNFQLPCKLYKYNIVNTLGKHLANAWKIAWKILNFEKYGSIHRR